MGAIVLGNGSNDVLELVALAFLGPGRAGGVLAALLRGLSARHAGARRALDRGAGEELRPRPRGDGEGDRRRHLRGVDRQPEQSRPAPSCAARRSKRFLERVPRARAGGARRGLQRIPAGRAARRHASSWLKRASRTWSLRAPSPRPTASPGLRVGYALAHPSVADVMNRVRQPFNVNSLALAAATRGARRHGVRRAQLRREPAGPAAARGGLARARPRLHPLARQLHHRPVGKAAEIYKRLLRRGVIVRPVAAATACPSTCASPSALPKRTSDSSPRSRPALKE